MFLKKLFKGLVIVTIAGYVLVCSLLYFYQESILFFPEQLTQEHEFQFKNDFIERDIVTRSGHHINTLLFKNEDSKGVILYLHGNAGSLKSVGNESENFLPLGYDVFLIDYAGYGKSSDKITNQEELFEDAQDVYDDLKKTYTEDKIHILGYSIGTGIAAHLASNNNPAKLILQSPYYSMTDMMKRKYSLIPTFILRYDLATNEYLKECDMPIYLFHGVEDKVIPIESSVMLSKEFDIPLYQLENQGHNGMGGNKEALQKLNEILNH